MSDQPIHTFIVCAYGQSPFLTACLSAMVGQETVKSGQSRLVLYTSTPSTTVEDQCKKLSIPYLTGNSRGIGADWNAALSQASTPLATLVHQDDIYFPDYGKQILAKMVENPKINISFTDYLELDKGGAVRPRNLNLKIKTFGLHLLSLSKNKTYQKWVYGWGNFICCPAVTFNLNRLKDFKFREDLQMVLDWDAWERIMKLPGEIAFLPQRLMGHRIHSDSETTHQTMNRAREAEEYQMFRRYHGERMSKLLMMAYRKNQSGNQTYE